MDQASAAEALQSAVDIADKVLPLQMPPTRSNADVSGLRQVALKALLDAMLAAPEDPGGEYADGDELLKPSEIARRFKIHPMTLRSWTNLGIITPASRRGRFSYYRLSEISRAIDMSPAERDALRIPVTAVTGADIDRMRAEEHLSWAELTRKTGLGLSALRSMHMRWLYKQSEAAAPETREPGD